MGAVLRNITIVLTQKNHDSQVLVNNASFEIKNGEILTIMGPSGYGKSTLLHYITGVIHTEVFECSGEIIIDNQVVNTLPTNKRRIGLFSQEGLLFPHMTVEENLLYAVPHTCTRQERKDIVAKTLENAQMESKYAHVYPHTLSGGQQSRLSLARTLLSEPQLLLLDEPFSKLDSDLRVAIRTWVWDIIVKSNIPAIIVTHNQEDIYNTQQCYNLCKMRHT